MDAVYNLDKQLLDINDLQVYNSLSFRYRIVWVSYTYLGLD
jgi:hypothetical protein